MSLLDEDDDWALCYVLRFIPPKPASRSSSSDESPVRPAVVT